MEKFKDYVPMKPGAMYSLQGNKGLCGSVWILMATGVKLMGVNGKVLPSKDLANGQVPADMIYRDDAYYLAAAYGPEVLAAPPETYPLRPAQAVAPVGGDATPQTPVPAAPKTKEGSSLERLVNFGFSFNDDEDLCFDGRVIKGKDGSPVKKSEAQAWSGGVLPRSIPRDSLDGLSIPSAALAAGSVSSHLWTLPKLPVVAGAAVAGRDAAIVKNGGTRPVGKEEKPIITWQLGRVTFKTSEGAEIILKDKNGGVIGPRCFDGDGKIDPKFFDADTLRQIRENVPNILK
jgi:hypothetical protein